MARSIRVTHPDPETHRNALFDLMGKSFGDYWGSLEYCRNGYIDESHYNWRTSRIGMLDDEIVSHFGVWDYRMRIGIDTVRTGGVGAVMTDPRYRRRGYMRATAGSACEALVEDGYGLSVLFGIPGFYQRFGYVSAWDTTLVTINERDLSQPQTRIKMRKVDFATDKGLESVVNKTNAGLTGTSVRPTYRRNRHPDSWECYRWQTITDNFGGYVVVEHDDQACTLIDCAGKSQEILSVCTQLVKRRGCSELKIPDLHRRHPLFDALRQVPYRREEYNNPSGGAMIRITNLVTCLSSIRKTLLRRLRESSFCEWTGMLTIQKERESAILVIDRRGVEVHDGSQAKNLGLRDREHRIRVGEELALFVIGLDDPYRLLELHGAKSSGDAKGLACALFPEQFPCLGKWDQF